MHFKLSEVEKNETEKESAQQVAKEAADVISGKPHSEANEAAETGTEVGESTKGTSPGTNSTQAETEQNSNATESSSEENESAEQRVVESP